MARILPKRSRWTIPGVNALPGGTNAGVHHSTRRASTPDGVLSGFTVAVTSGRRDEDLSSALAAHGARIVVAPAVRLVPVADGTWSAGDSPLAQDADDAGDDLVELPGYRWAAPVDPAPLQRLIDLIINHLVDAVTFTSAAAAGSVLRAAGARVDAVLTALRGPVLAGCLGPQAAHPLRRAGVPVLLPAQARVSALIATLLDELPRRAQTVRVGASELVLRGHAAIVNGVLKPLPPAQMAILRRLVAAQGRVLPRTELLAALPRGAGEHAVEMAVARLRAALGRGSFIQTVVKRGYRLRID